MSTDTGFAPNMFLNANGTSLRAFSEEDIYALGKWWDDQRVTHFLEMGVRPTRPKDLASFWRVASEAEDAVVFTICEAGSGRAIGTCGLYAISWIARRGQFNILIGEPDSWDQAHGQTAARLCLAYAFQTLGLESVQLGVNADNIRAIRSYEKVGFVKEGLRRHFIYRNGRYYDMVEYSVLREEFKGFFSSHENIAAETL